MSFAPKRSQDEGAVRAHDLVSHQRYERRPAAIVHGYYQTDPTIAVVNGVADHGVPIAVLAHDQAYVLVVDHRAPLVIPGESPLRQACLGELRCCLLVQPHALTFPPKMTGDSNGDSNEPRHGRPPSAERGQSPKAEDADGPRRTKRLGLTNEGPNHREIDDVEDDSVYRPLHVARVRSRCLEGGPAPH